MSCLPLSSFTPSLSAVLKLDDVPSTSRSRSDEQQSPHPLIAQGFTDEVDGRYDKLSPVSVSHRRVDSFEWPMAQSAPNTPPTSLGSNYKSYSPPAIRAVGSAPLPVPNETWSTRSQAGDGRQKRGYFDWWPSPILEFDKGYTKLSTSDYENEPDLQSPSVNEASETGISRTVRPQTGLQTAIHPSSDDNRNRALRELNALGIVISYTSPSSLPPSHMLRAHEPKVFPRPAAPQLLKRVSFSPVIDEVVSETSPGFDSANKPVLLWGSYLPSSFLVALPPLTRTTSSPAARRTTTTTRPILKRSSSAHQHLIPPSTPSTELICLVPKSGPEDTVIVASPTPTHRLSTRKLRADGLRQVGGDLGETDSTFVDMLQSTKPTRCRCDSLLSNTSFSVDTDCRIR
ncbi:hypothetical protein SVAN01_07505 [Stagonosporopsis vannaccii]|nr:hypothetical protein SVAN01_07505 [Stagonosporopsis vannaccii]